jgi:tRNA/tmRNA/rRNA uracil-C5-methylase (TrmA/RlmC/RlmD family)|nr:hypothetical protein [Neorhizobium tomejilense]
MSVNKHLQQLRRMVEEFAEEYEIERTKSGHLAVRLARGGAKVTVFAPGTPSDHRSMLNVRTKLKRAASELIERAA